VRSKSEDAPEVGADQLALVLERLESLEATMVTVEATVGLLDTYVRELRQDRERGRTAVHPRPDPAPAAARPAPPEENGETAARSRGKGGKPLPPETDKLIADMLRAGRPYSEIAPKAGVSIGAITKIRKRLGV
jgi:hypothetical protein